MFLFNLFLVLFFVLLFLKCQRNPCNQDNIFQTINDLGKSFLGFVFDVVSYAVKKFFEINWFQNNQITSETIQTPITPSTN